MQNILFLSLVGVSVSVCVCVYVHPPWRFLLPAFGVLGDRSTMLCWRLFFPLLSSYIATLEWSTKPFQIVALSCLHTRSGQSHDLASLRLTFKTLGLHLPLSGITLTPRYIVNRSTPGIRLSRDGSLSNYERLK